MRSSANPFVYAVLLCTLAVIPRSVNCSINGGGGCCMLYCAAQTQPCDCQCGFPFLQLPPLPSLPTFPQFPAFTGGNYATPIGSFNTQQQPFDNGYLQQPRPFQIQPSDLSQQPLAYQGNGIYGFGVTQFEQPQRVGNFGGYATGPFGAQPGAVGDLTSTYNLSPNDNRPPLPPPLPSSMGQYVSGPPINIPQPNVPNTSPVATGMEYQPAPAQTPEYLKKSKTFMKVQKS